jgi:serine/threonine-protein kinase HipA
MLTVFANKKEAGFLDYRPEEREFVFNYTQENPISLTMPYRTKSYLSFYHLHPIFDMSMPEGYLFELFKNLLTKEYGDMDDFILFAHLSKTIEGYLTYRTQGTQKEGIALNLEAILHGGDEDLFFRLLELFLDRSAVAGVQPKVLAQLHDKATLSTREYIVKSFGDEFPHLAENEYFCMKAISYAGIPVPKFWLSDNKKLFLVEKFTYLKEGDGFYGFEEFCVLFGLNKEKKYSGSYEKIARSIARISTQKQEDLRIFYKMIVMSFLLKNGDAHLKNFGILYEAGIERRFLAPAYDVVTTCIYLPRDKPALTLAGKKLWFDREALEDFGVRNCMLSPKVSKALFEVCIAAVEKMKGELMEYTDQTPEFETFGKRFLQIIDFSLSENLECSYKDSSRGIL